MTELQIVIKAKLKEIYNIDDGELVNWTIISSIDVFNSRPWNWDNSSCIKVISAKDLFFINFPPGNVSLDVKTMRMCAINSTSSYQEWLKNSFPYDGIRQSNKG